jgi:hypothetical protein
MEGKNRGESEANDRERGGTELEVPREDEHGCADDIDSDANGR